MDIFLVPFSFLWAGFAVFWEMTVIRNGAGFMVIWGVPFLLVGFYVTIGRFLLDSWVRGQTVYGLTGDRALLLRQLGAARLLTVRLGGAVNLQAGKADRGTLEFGAKSGFSEIFNSGRNPMAAFAMWTPSLGDQVRFIGVERVMEAYRIAGSRAP